jgi:hypothetical protein
MQGRRERQFIIENHPQHPGAALQAAKHKHWKTIDSFLQPDLYCLVVLKITTRQLNLFLKPFGKVRVYQKPRTLKLAVIHWFFI